MQQNKYIFISIFMSFEVPSYYQILWSDFQVWIEEGLEINNFFKMQFPILKLKEQEKTMGKK